MQYSMCNILSCARHPGAQGREQMCCVNSGCDNREVLETSPDTGECSECYVRAAYGELCNETRHLDTEANADQWGRIDTMLSLLDDVGADALEQMWARKRMAAQKVVAALAEPTCLPECDEYHADECPAEAAYMKRMERRFGLDKCQTREERAESIQRFSHYAPVSR